MINEHGQSEQPGTGQCAEEALRESEEKYRLLIENSGEAILCTEPNGRIISANPEACRIFGRSEAEICQVGCAGLIDSNDPRLPAALKEREECGKFKGELNMLRKDGTVFPAEFSTAVYQGSAGHVYTSMIIRDITERKRVEEQIQTKAQEQEWLLRSMIDAFVIFQSVFDENGRFISYRFEYINDAHERITGTKMEDVRGKTVHEVWPETEASWLEQYGAVAVSGIPRTFDMYHKPTAKLYHCHVYRPWETAERFCVIFEDITERKRAEEALRESEERFKRISLVISDFAYSCRKPAHGSYQIDWMTDAVERITGYSVEEVIDRKCWEFLVLPEDLPLFERNVTGLVPGQSSRSELRIRHKGGEVRWLQTSTECLADPQDPSCHRIFGGCVDITDRKRAEEVLRESEERFHSLFENSTIGLYRTTPNGEILLANPTLCQMLGFTTFEDLAHRNLEKEGFEPGVPRQIFRQALEEIGQIQALESAWKRKDGTSIFVRESARAVRDVKGHILYFEGTVEDITERKQAEEALRESEAQYRKLIETMQDGVYRSSHEGKFLEVNPAMVKILGYDSKEELLAIDIKTQLYFAPGDRESAALEEKLSEMGVFRLRKKDGSEIWVEDHGRHVVNNEGIVLYHEGVLRDITDRKQLEEQILQVRSDLLFAVSHDLKSPLQTLRQTQEMLRELPPAEALARFQEYSEIWRRNLQRLERMINNLVDSQRSEEGRFPLLLAPCDPVEMVQRVAEDLTGYALPFQVTFDLNLQPLPQGFCDEEALARVVENLLTNAVKFSPKGGQVKVSLKLEEKALLLEVEDHGIGIPAEEQQQLFQPFQRGRSAQRKGIPGTGLGLYVSRRIVEEHGGALTLKSEEGRGTIVTVRLPWKKKPEQG